MRYTLIQDFYIYLSKNLVLISFRMVCHNSSTPLGIVLQYLRRMSQIYYLPINKQMYNGLG